MLCFFMCVFLFFELPHETRPRGANFIIFKLLVCTEKTSSFFKKSFLTVDTNYGSTAIEFFSNALVYA